MLILPFRDFPKTGWLLLAQLPPDGGRRLFELWKQIPERRAGRDQPRSPVAQLRDLLIRMSEP
jgi:hypothetical protein